MADRNTLWEEGKLNHAPLAAATVLYYGHMWAKNAAGYLVLASDTAGLTVCGMGNDTDGNNLNNALGAAGDTSAEYRRGFACWFANDGTNPVTLADLDADVYVKDSETVCVAAGATNNIVAGKALEIDAVKGVKVFIPIG